MNRREKPLWEQMLIMAEMYSPEMAASVIRDLKRRGMNVPEPVMGLLERKAASAKKPEEGAPRA